MRKTANILIREGTKRTSNDNVLSINSSNSILSKTNVKQNIQHCQQKVKDKKRVSDLGNIVTQKQMIRAETLSEQQQLKIHNQAKKTAIKKVKASQSKIENEMVDLLEQQCKCLGSQLQKQKIQNLKLKSQIQKLRKNIHTLNEKLQKVHDDHSSLTKNQIEGKFQNKQLLQQIIKLKNQISQKDSKIQILNDEKQQFLQKYKTKLNTLQENIKKINQQKDIINEEKSQIEEQLKQKIKDVQYIRQCFEAKKTQWQMYQKQIQIQTKNNLEKKGEKITKIQTQGVKLQQKLKDQQTVRKKAIQKNNMLQKQINILKETNRELEDQLSNLKKRVNDLSILKSSNATIMNQKMAKLNEENQKLKNQIQQLKGCRKPKILIEKPVLFGSEDL